jgi:hypothetical protein
MHKIIYYTISSLAILLASTALAEKQQQAYEVYVDIPTANFYVLPANPTLFTHAQELQWNIRTSEFTPLRTHLNVRNSAGGLYARLSERPFLQAGLINTSTIELQVTLHKTTLSEIRQEIFDQSVKDDMRIELNIQAIKPLAGYTPGLYLGSVSLIFDSAVP